jgi:hypothetical protein
VLWASSKARLQGSRSSSIAAAGDQQMRQLAADACCQARLQHF